MILTTRKPATVEEILVERVFRSAQNLLPRKHVNELCNDRRGITASTALILARFFGNSAEFWPNVQRRIDLWETMNSPDERARIERAKPVMPVA